MQDALLNDFSKLSEAHRSALRLHCYRMIGSLHDAEDLVQETLVRAWRARESFEGRASLRSWLTRIATNMCLTELGRKPRRALSSTMHPAADPIEPEAAPIDEPVWLEPCPDAWLEGAEPGPEARYSLREGVALAFVAALHMLPPEQRAILLLRDAMGLSAEETADALGLSLAAANSALHRARTSIRERTGGRDPSSFASLPVEQGLLTQYIRAWESADLDALVALLREDIEVSMPPSPTWLSGLAAAHAFLKHQIFARTLPGRLKILLTGANGHPALVFYRRAGDQGSYSLSGLQVLTFVGDRLSTMHMFKTPAIFPVFGLAPSLDDAKASVPLE